MKRDWLWDRDIPAGEVKRILRDPRHQRFVTLAALLLSRNNSPRMVFKEFLDREVFCMNWAKIKRQMRKDSWNDPRIVFWEAVYKRLREEYRKKGIPIRIRHAVREPGDELCRKAGEKIRELRRQKGLTQREIAGRLRVSQQVVSRIEKGRENVTVLTLKKVARCLGADLKVDIG